MSATQLEQAAQATKTAFVFPGQGSQKAGMLAELAEQFSAIRETFAEASEAVGFDLWQIARITLQHEKIFLCNRFVV